MDRSKIEEKTENDQDSDCDTAPIGNIMNMFFVSYILSCYLFSITAPKQYPHTHWGRHNAKMDLKRTKDGDLVNKDQLVKKRLRLEHLKERENRGRLKNEMKRKKSLTKKLSKSKGRK